MVTLPDTQTTRKRPINWMLFLFANAFLLILFGISKGRISGVAALNAVFFGYFFVLGFPTTLTPCICPDLVRENPHAWVSVYIVNFVVVSYFLGKFISWSWHKISSGNNVRENRPTPPV